MKKALILALTVLTVLCMATAALAVEVSYEGEVAVKWGNNIDNTPDVVQKKDADGKYVYDDEGNPVFEDTDKKTGFAQDSLEAAIKVNFLKDFGDGVTAGVKTRVRVHKDEHANFDGGGWVQLERDLFTAKAATKIKGNAAKDLGGEYDLGEFAGIGVDLRPIEGLTINTVLNAGTKYGYVVKGEFAQDLFTVGAGYQGEKLGTKIETELLTADLTGDKTALAVYGTANVIEPLTLGAEYAMRKIAYTDEAVLGGAKELDAKAILANAAYKDDAIDASASFLMQDAGFLTLATDDDDYDKYLLRHDVKSGKFSPKYDYMIVFADAAYKVTDDFEINGKFDYMLSAKDGDTDLTDAQEDALTKISYKAGVAYTLDALKLEGWYKAYIANEVGAKATYALADGVDASFKVAYGKADKDSKDDGKVSYTAMVKAAL